MVSERIQRRSEFLLGDAGPGVYRFDEALIRDRAEDVLGLHRQNACLHSVPPNHIISAGDEDSGRSRLVAYHRTTPTLREGRPRRQSYGGNGASSDLY